MSNDLTVYDRVSDPLAYAERMGLALARSGMFGSNFNAEAGMVVAMTCLCERITALDFLRTYHIIQGRPTMQADAMLAEFRNRGGKHKQIKSTPDQAVIELTDSSGTSNTFSVTWEDAKQENWTQVVDKNGEVHIKENWQGPLSRQDMLWHTVCKRAVRRMAPEIAYGVYTPDEAEAYPLPAAAETESVSLPSAVATPFVYMPLVEVKEVVDRASQAVSDQATAKMMEQPVLADGRQQGPLRANDVQVARVLQLFQQLEFPVDKIDAALQKRGVIKVNQLTPSMADEIIEKLQGMVAEKN